MDKQRKLRLTVLIEAFVRICNKYELVSSQAIDYGSGDLLFPSEIHMLNYLSKNPEKNISEIGRYFGISKSAASQTVMKLEKKGFCTKSKPVNRKNIYLDLTAKGYKALDFFRKYRNDIFSDLIKAFEPADEKKIGVVEELFFHLEKHMDVILDKRCTKGIIV